MHLMLQICAVTVTRDFPLLNFRLMIHHCNSSLIVTHPWLPKKTNVIFYFFFFLVGRGGFRKFRYLLSLKILIMKVLLEEQKLLNSTVRSLSLSLSLSLSRIWSLVKNSWHCLIIADTFSWGKDSVISFQSTITLKTSTL